MARFDFKVKELNSTSSSKPSIEENAGGTPGSPQDFFIAGGTLHSGAPSYIERAADGELLQALLKGEYCYVLTSRQMGKSSIMSRTSAALKAAGRTVAIIDTTAVGQNVNPEQWYDGLLALIGRQLRLEDELDDYWMDHARIGPIQRWFNALHDVVLPRLTGPLVIFVDEVDALKSLPFQTDEFFAAIRECYNRRTSAPGYERITFCLLGVARPSELIRDPDRTPFNIGRRIELPDFTPDESAALVNGLSRAFGSELLAKQVLQRIVEWTNGHPYLTQCLCQDLHKETLSNDPAQIQSLVDGLCHQRFLSPRAREIDDNLIFVRQRILRGSVELIRLLELYELIWSGKTLQPEMSQESLDELLMAGLVRMEGDQPRVRNRIYRTVFDQKWILENLPIAELVNPNGDRIRVRENLTIGRTSSNDLVLNDVKISRLHAMIQKQGKSEMYLQDRGSRNGTFLNAQKISSSMRLRDGDQIMIGPFQFTFHQPGASGNPDHGQTSFDKTHYQTETGMNDFTFGQV